MCISVCLDDAVDVDTIEVDAYTTQSFSIDFHTGTVPDTGQVRIGFRNTGTPDNQFAYWFQCTTTEASEVEDANQRGFRLYPNPNAGNLRVEPSVAEAPTYSFQLYDLHGRAVYNSGQVHGPVNVDADLDAGIYVLLLSVEDGSRFSELVEVVR